MLWLRTHNIIAWEVFPMVPYATLRLRLFPHLRWGFANYSINYWLMLLTFALILLSFRDYTNSAGRQHSLLSPLDCLPAKAGGAVNGGAYAPFILTVDWLCWLCYCLYEHNSRKQYPISPSMQIDLLCISFGQYASVRFTQA